MRKEVQRLRIDHHQKVNMDQSAEKSKQMHPERVLEIEGTGDDFAQSISQVVKQKVHQHVHFAIVIVLAGQIRNHESHNLDRDKVGENHREPHVQNTFNNRHRRVLPLRPHRLPGPVGFAGFDCEQVTVVDFAHAGLVQFGSVLVQLVSFALAYHKMTVFF